MYSILGLSLMVAVCTRIWGTVQGWNNVLCLSFLPLIPVLVLMLKKKTSTLQYLSIVACHFWTLRPMFLLMWVITHQVVGEREGQLVQFVKDVSPRVVFLLVGKLQAAQVLAEELNAVCILSATRRIANLLDATHDAKRDFQCEPRLLPWLVGKSKRDNEAQNNHLDRE